MTKIVDLKDPQTNEQVLPISSSSAIYREDGSTVESKLKTTLSYTPEETHQRKQTILDNYYTKTESNNLYEPKRNNKFYLDEEIDTGTVWYDDRKIYRYTKYIASPPNSTSWQNLFQLGNPNIIDTFIKIEGFLNEGKILPLPVAEGNYYRNFRYDQSTGYIQTINNGFTGAMYLTVYYLKK